MQKEKAIQKVMEAAPAGSELQTTKKELRCFRIKVSAPDGELQHFTVDKESGAVEKHHLNDDLEWVTETL